MCFRFTISNLKDKNRYEHMGGGERFVTLESNVSQ